MISVVIPIHYRNAGLLCSATELEDGISPRFIGSLPTLLHRCKETPVSEIIVVSEGGSHGDWEDLHEIARDAAIPIHIHHDKSVTSFERAAVTGMQAADGPLVLVMAPWVVIEDSNLVGKFQNVILKSPNAGIVSIIESKSSTAPPHPVHNKGARLDMDFFATTKQAIELHLKDEPMAFESFHVNLVRSGHRIWEHPGIRYFKAAHKEHLKKIAPVW